MANTAIANHIAIVAGALLLVSCGDMFVEKTLSAPAFDGIVVDQTTQAPVAGAVVVREWYGSRGGLAHSSTVWYHTETAVSDDQGHFRISAWSIPNVGMMTGPISDSHDGIWAYAHGYAAGHQLDQNPALIAMPPFTGTRAEHFVFLFDLSGLNSGGYDNSIKNLIPLRVAALREAHELAETPKEKHTAEQMEWNLNFLCAMPAGHGVEMDPVHAPTASPDIPFPPPPCTDKQLKER